MDRAIKTKSEDMKRKNKTKLLVHRQKADEKNNPKLGSMKHPEKHAPEGGCSAVDKLSKFKFGRNFVTNIVPDEYEESDNDALNPVPKVHPLSNNVWPYVLLNAKDTALTSYIFMSDEQNQYGDEILTNTRFRMVGTRNNLKTLTPKRFVDQEVINLLCCKLTYEGNCVAKTAGISNWFLPTFFSQYVIARSHSHQEIIGFYQKDFMGKVDSTSKIFIPIHDEDHWYLMVVDMIREIVFLLDSLPSDRTYLRRFDVSKVAMFLEEMLVDDSFYAHVIKYDPLKPKIHTYPIVSPTGVPRQSFEGNDCGVWVATWMQEYRWKDDYNFIQVCPNARMKLAMDLVSSSYNELMDEVEKKATDHWTNMQKFA